MQGASRLSLEQANRRSERFRETLAIGIRNLQNQRNPIGAVVGVGLPRDVDSERMRRLTPDRQQLVMNISIEVGFSI